MSQDRKLVAEPVIVAPVEMGTRALNCCRGHVHAKHNVGPVCRAAQDELTTESFTKSDVPPEELRKGNRTAQTDHRNKPG